MSAGTPVAELGLDERMEERRASRGRTRFAPPGTRLVLYSLVALMVVRFFSEGVRILPRSSTFIDIPIVALLALVAATRGSQLRPSRTYFGAGLAFLAMAVVATLANPSRVAPAPVIVFVYDFLAPLGIYYAVYRLWPPGHAGAASSMLVALALLQFPAVAGFQLPHFLSTHNPDEISGTFGDNAYQLVFFLLVVTALLTGIWIFEHGRPAARLAPFMLVGFALIIFLAQFRALLLTALLAVLAIAFFATKARPAKGIVIGAFALIVFVASFGYVATHFPRLKLRQTFTTLRTDPWFFVHARVHALDDVVSLYGDNPRFIVTGTGPGTFSSRAWETFAKVTDTRTAVATPYARALNGGAAYETDVADKYTVERLATAPVIQGSKAVASPFASYTSLMAEVGLPGFLIYVGIYLAALGRAARLFLRRIRRPTRSDPLPALLLATTIAFFVLLQLAFLDNWLEVTRITFLSWAMLAIVTRETDADERAAVE